MSGGAVNRYPLVEDIWLVKRGAVVDNEILNCGIVVLAWLPVHLGHAGTTVEQPDTSRSSRAICRQNKYTLKTNVR